MSDPETPEQPSPPSFEVRPEDLPAPPPVPAVPPPPVPDPLANERAWDEYQREPDDKRAFQAMRTRLKQEAARDVAAVVAHQAAVAQQIDPLVQYIQRESEGIDAGLLIQAYGAEAERRHPGDLGAQARFVAAKGKQIARNASARPISGSLSGEPEREAGELTNFVNQIRRIQPPRR